MKEFTDADVLPSTVYDGWIQADRSELMYDPPEWMKRGLQIHFNGKLYRIYVTIYSNAGTSWFTAKGKRYSVS